MSFSRCSSRSVRPLLFCNFEATSNTEHMVAQVENDVADRDGVEDLQKHAVLNDPIVGQEVTIMDDRGPGALAARPLPSPQTPSPQAVWRHFISHLSDAPWCQFCVAFRKPNHHHRRRRSDGRETPLMVAADGFVRNSRDAVILKLLVVRIDPSRLWFACVVDRKGG